MHYYITTPIYYLNDAPHIGHAYTTLAADFIARFKRLDGFNVHFLTGTDEYGQKIAKTAKSLNIAPIDLVNENTLKFQTLFNIMNFSYDDFIRTTEDRHKKFVQKIWTELCDKDAIYLGKYSGWYAVRDEAFYNESELIDGKAPTGADVEWLEEESYFFRLSKFRDKLLDFLNQNPDFIMPKAKRNEILSFLQKEELRDLSISRTGLTWGIPVPGNDKHVIYVWLDALFNYISALKSPNDIYKQYWPANLQIIGKDILRFHAIYWPAFLMALDLPLPKRIFAHGWWTNDGQKISKSLGNTINPLDLVNEFGVDYVRYFMMRDIVFGSDGSYTRERLISRVNAELANSIGNLAQRVLTFIYKHCDSKIPKHHEYTEEDQTLLHNAYSLINRMREMIDIQALSEVLEDIYKLSNDANVYVDKQAPWSLKNTDIQRMETVLYVLAETIRIIAIALQPIVPESAAKFVDILNLGENNNKLMKCNESGAFVAGHKIKEPYIVFQRLLEK